MLKTNVEYKKGIFFIRLEGPINKESSIKLKKEIIPLLLKNGFKYVVLNLNDVEYIDSYGIDLIDEINDIVMRFGGKTTLIKNKKVERMLSGSIIDNILYRASSETSALGVFEL